MVLLDSAQRPVHVTLSGTIFGGAEEWQTGFYVGSATQDAAVPTQGYVDAVRDAWSIFFAKNDSFISDAYTFTAVKAVLLGKDGRYNSDEPVQSFPTGIVKGAYGGSPMPPQIALVATLIGGSGKGLGGKGRMYLPGVSTTIGGNGYIPTVNVQSIATNLAAFFNTIDASANTPGHVINVSRGHKNLLGAGARNVKVNGVRVGNVYDTQRRRREALAETYSAAVVAD